MGFKTFDSPEVHCGWPDARCLRSQPQHAQHRAARAYGDPCAQASCSCTRCAPHQPVLLSELNTKQQ